MISILLATYNGDVYIEEQLNSIINQTYTNWKLYIRDDGSSDRTLEIIEQYRIQDPRIVLISDNLGNLGTRDQYLYLLSIVESEYYMFCDQDDVWCNDKIEKSLKYIRNLEGRYSHIPVLVGSDCYMCGPNLEIINKSCWDHLRIAPKKFLTKNGIFVYPFVTGASMIMNRTARDIIPPIPNGMPKNRPMYDWWVLIQVFKHGHVELIEESTRFYRQHSNNVSGGLDKLNTSYWHKIKKIKIIWRSNRTRLKVLKAMGYGPTLKYWFFKGLYLLKMMNYRHKK